MINQEIKRIFNEVYFDLAISHRKILDKFILQTVNESYIVINLCTFHNIYFYKFYFDLSKPSVFIIKRDLFILDKSKSFMFTLKKRVIFNLKD